MRNTDTKSVLLKQTLAKNTCLKLCNYTLKLLKMFINKVKLYRYINYHIRVSFPYKQSLFSLSVFYFFTIDVFCSHRIKKCLKFESQSLSPQLSILKLNFKQRPLQNLKKLNHSIAPKQINIIFTLSYIFD